MSPWYGVVPTKNIIFLTKISLHEKFQIYDISYQNNMQDIMLKFIIQSLLHFTPAVCLQQGYSFGQDSGVSERANDTE